MRIRGQVVGYHLLIFDGKCEASDVPKFYVASWNVQQTVFKILSHFKSDKGLKP